jgi:hypothetical protein
VNFQSEPVSTKAFPTAYPEDMKLRDHPKMKCRRLPNWPPMSWATSSKKPSPASGEGVLQDVRVLEPNHPDVSRQMELTVLHRGDNFSTVFCFDDPDFVPRIRDFLATCKGRTIGEISEVEVPSDL